MRFPSNATKACPPTLVAPTNKRSGSNSISSKPQISCCRRTASSKSACAVSARTSIGIVSLGFLPQCFHLFDGRARQLRVLLDMCEALAEFRIRFAEGLLRIDLKKSREVHQNEQEIAKLAFQFRGISILARVSQLVKFFVKFFEHLIGILPIEAGGCRLGADLLGLHQCRKMAGNSFQQSTLRLTLALFLVDFDFVPAALHIVGSLGVACRKHLRMPANQLLRD